MLKIHDLTPDFFIDKNLLSNQKSTMISDYSYVSGVNFAFDEDSYLCEVELPKSPGDTVIKSLELNLLDYIDWSYLVKNPSKKLILTHRIIYNLEDYLTKLNDICLRYNLKDRVFWLTFNPLDFKISHLCEFKLLFLDSLTNVLFEGRINNTYFVKKFSQDPNKSHKYQYGFEPKNNTFEMLDIDYCDKYFMSSTRSVKAHRLLSTYLINKNIELDKGIVTYHGLEDVNLNMYSYLKNYQEALDKQGINFQELLDFRSFRGQNFDDVSKHPFERSLQPSFINAYKQCLINYVNESTANEVEIFITEKIWLNYAHGKPFILNGNKDTLRYLNKYYGFKSFPMLFDESYDSKDNFVDRVCHGVNELVKFCSLSFEDAKDKVKSVQKILDHNFKVFYSLNHKEKFLRIFDGI